MPPDRDLLRQFADHRDEAAFAELVRRQADFVYSVALRVTCNSALAQDVTQAVFTLVALQAGKLQHYETLIGWLHTTTRHVAINTVRGEARRRVREQEATAMQNDSTAPEMNWTEIGPLLDEAVSQLKEADRNAVLLRFFKNLSHQEVGAALGLGEEAARKRVDRALDKLREHFARRGVKTSSVLLSAVIAENSVQAAPVGFAAQVTAASLTAAGTGVSGGYLLSLIFMSTKTKTILAVVVVLVIFALLAIKLGGPPRQSNSATVATVPSLATPFRVTIRLRPMPQTQVAAPIVTPAPAGGSSGATVLDVISGGTMTMDSPPPNADLKTAIPSLVHYLETDDFVHVIPFVMTPAEVQQALDSSQAASLLDLAEKLRAKLYEQTDGNIKKVVDMLNAIKNQTPRMDETGSKAIYPIDPQFPGDVFIFLKKDGLWYFYGNPLPGESI